MKRLFAFTAFFAVTIALLSCSGPGRNAVIKSISAKNSAGRYIENVPFFAQTERMCGPAALASVIGFYGAGTKMEDVAKEVYLEKLKGTLPIDLVIYAKKKGFEAVYYSGGLDDLKEKLRAGKPLILFLNLGFESYPIGHYVTAVGFDDALEAVLAHSGAVKEDVFSYRELLAAWQKTNFASLLITPKKP